MATPRTRFLDSDAVADHAAYPAVVETVEAAFAADATGEAQMPAKSYIDLPEYGGDFRSMPAYVDVRAVELPDRPWRGAGPSLDWDAAGIKWVNVHPENRTRYSLPTVLGTYIYSDPANGFPLAVMDGRELTRRRTGAAAAVATDRLARPDASSLGLIGAGAQADAQLRAIDIVRDIDTVVIHDRNESAMTAFVEAFEGEFSVRAGTIGEAGHCDILSTVTPVEDPIVTRGDIGEGTHINAIGADAPGKHELANDLLTDATIVIDDYEQCTHSGEINVPWAAGILDDDDIAAELGAVVAGQHHGRTDTAEITVFDSTGLAIQDVAAAHVVYDGAIERGAGEERDLLGV